MEKGINPKEFRAKGGLDKKTYDGLKGRWNRRQGIISKYGSLKAAPISTGPCKKIDPVVGNKNALVLLTEFKDKKHTHLPEDLEKKLFTKGSRSLRDYYLEASWNQLDITGKVSNQWYSADGNIMDYSDEAVHIKYPYARKLVKETVLNAKKSGFDFSPFAVDGKIELLMVIHAGKGQNTALKIEYIRPHQGWVEEPIEVQDGIVIDRYILAPELPIEDIGCYCHEVGHLIGLPDFYNMKSPVVGGWCLMGVGDHIDDGKTPAHPSAWCKVHLGWREPVIIEKPPDVYDIPAVSDVDGSIYKIDVHDSGGKEYFLLENRQQKGFDEKLPGSGLLIWHVDENRCVLNPPNSDFNHLFLTLVQSDGGDELQRDVNQLMKEMEFETLKKEITGNDGDPYPGITSNRNFDMKSNPRSISRKGTDSHVRVTSISDSSDVMRAEIGVQPPSGVNKLDTKKPASQTESNTDKIARHVLQNYMELMTTQKEGTPYIDGYEAGKLDRIEGEIEKSELICLKRLQAGVPLWFL